MKLLNAPLFCSFTCSQKQAALRKRFQSSVLQKDASRWATEAAEDQTTCPVNRGHLRLPPDPHPLLNLHRQQLVFKFAVQTDWRKYRKKTPPVVSRKKQERAPQPTRSEAAGCFKLNKKQNFGMKSQQKKLSVIFLLVSYLGKINTEVLTKSLRKIHLLICLLRKD